VSIEGRIKIEEIAKHLSISLGSVYELLEKRILLGIRLGRRWIVTRQAFKAWEDTCGKEAIIAHGEHKLAA
jgi:excisionase family DNA binding protein